LSNTILLQFADSFDSDMEDKTFSGINLKEELQRSQNLVNHLTGLLKESEANNERLSELSDALKEEIRRSEREYERKAHLKENTEYLKNILLKVSQHCLFFKRSYELIN